MTNTLRLALVAPLLAVLVGCGEQTGDEGIATAGGAATPGPSASASPTLDDDERRLAYAGCLRENGLDVPDPEPGQGGGIRMRIPRGGDREKAEAAMAACRQYAPNGGEAPRLNAEQLAQMREFAKCMRANGVPEFPDPQPDGRILIEAFRGLDPDSVEFQAAQEKCRQFAPRRPRASGGTT